MKLSLFNVLAMMPVLLAGCSHSRDITFDLDPRTGALSGLYVSDDTSMNWILRPDGTQYEWVDSRYGWGLGSLCVNGTVYSWDTPVALHAEDNRMDVKYQAGDIEINVFRIWNEDGNLIESYEFVNTGNEAAGLHDIAVNTPFNDNYPDARTCIDARCNAHIWAGGNDSYVYCTRMSGAPGGLGLILKEGAVNGYQVCGRSEKTGGSNFRGVIRLEPEDRMLQPGESYTVRWLVLPAVDWDDFHEKAIENGLVVASADRYVAEKREDVTVSFCSSRPSLEGRLLLNGEEVSEVSGDNISYTTAFDEPGEYVFTLSYDDGRHTSVKCLCVSSFDSMIDRRCHFIADRQQFFRPGDPRNGAFIVYDNDTESQYVNGESGWERADCDEGRERVAMGILLAMQYQRTRDMKLKDAMDRYVSFVHRIQKEDYTTNSTADFHGYNRGYNYPWVADFWFTMFNATGERQFLKDGYGTLRALFRQFGHGFYCIGIPTYGYSLLKENGYATEADTLLNDFRLMADMFCANGHDYPVHEVNYEQSIVAPSVIHLLNMYMLTGEEKYLKGAESQLPLLESFGGRQPDFHLNDIAVRHWDGFWFGKDRIWGDTFPHYWSTLTGIAFRLYAEATRKQEYAERALNIFRNNFCLFTEDGRGSCAYVYPDKVDGRKAGFYDPFANDQDWAMVHWLKYGPDFTETSRELPYRRADMPVEERVKDLLQRMTLEEKLAQVRHIHSWEIFNGQELDRGKLESRSQGMSWGFVEGFPLTAENCAENMSAIQHFMVEETRLGIPVFTVAESLHGVVHEGATVFPQNVALGSTFNPDLAYHMASMISGELHSVGMRQTLSPCIDVVRDLRWGRVEESFGEDPYLCGLFGIAEVKGYMDNGISPMLKHFGPHGNPLGGLNLASVETSVRDLHEVYLKPFEMVMDKTCPLAVMSAYNSWNRVPNSASSYLLTDILRDRWKFEGYVYSDWGAVEMLKSFHSTAAGPEEAALQALTAGLDVEASSDCFRTVPALVESGKLDIKVLDEAVSRVLYAKFRIGLFDDPYGERFAGGTIHSQEAVDLSRKIADESAVLLKNDGNLLPLDPGKLESIAVIGPNADQIQFGDYTWTRDNRFGVTPLQGIREYAGDRVKVNYAKGCDLVSMDESGIGEAVAIAKESDVSVIFCGSASAALARDYSSSTCGEGFDLSDLTLTGAQPELIRAVCSTGKPVVLVLVTGKPFAIPWEKKNIPSILVQWYAGEQSGHSIADILFGKVSPSGRLTFSFPESTGHLPVYYNHLRSDRGFYKSPGSYDSPGRDYVFSAPVPLWSFGHGLTYTSFGYSGLKTDRTTYTPDDTVHVQIKLKNTGRREWKEVVQLYVSDLCSSVSMPVRQLRDFRKVTLGAGRSATVRLEIPVRELTVLNEQNEAVVEPGEFEIQVGSASDCILLRKTIHVGQPGHAEDRQEQAVYKSDRQMTVQGVIRDVQATLIPDVQIYEKTSGRIVGKSDGRGHFSIRTGNREILCFWKKGYETLEKPVDNQENINLRMNYGSE